jgi:hypothetical protein
LPLGVCWHSRSSSPRRQFLETDVRQRIQETVPIRKMPVERHRRDADRFSQPPHRNGGRPFPIEQFPGRARSRLFANVYNVYHYKYTAYTTRLRFDAKPLDWVLIV